MFGRVICSVLCGFTLRPNTVTAPGEYLELKVSNNSFISQMISSIPLLCKNMYASRPIQHEYFHPIPKHISITIQQAPGYAPSHSLSHDFERCPY